MDIKAVFLTSFKSFSKITSGRSGCR